MFPKPLSRPGGDVTKLAMTGYLKAGERQFFPRGWMPDPKYILRDFIKSMGATDAQAQSVKLLPTIIHEIWLWV